MNTFNLSENLQEMIGAAVAHYWETRLSQQRRQEQSGRVDAGLRSAVTGGAQMDGFVELFTRLIVSTGLDIKLVQRKGSLQLPGFFSSNKGVGPSCREGEKTHCCNRSQVTGWTVIWQ